MHSSTPSSNASGVYQADTEGTSELHEEVAQIPMVPIPATVPSLSQPVPVALWGVPCDQLTEEEKIQAWFSDGPAHYSGTIQK